MSSYVFIDSRVQDIYSVLAGLSSEFQVIILDPSLDGIAQIAQALEGVTVGADLRLSQHTDAGVIRQFSL